MRWPFTKKEENLLRVIKIEFNAVIEGTYGDDWSGLNYKIAQLQFPEDATVF